LYDILFYHLSRVGGLREDFSPDRAAHREKTSGPYPSLAATLVLVMT